MFKPKGWLEGRLLKPGTYDLQVRAVDERLLPSGKRQLLVRFGVAQASEVELVDWWQEDVEPVLRRVCQLAQFVNPKLLDQEYPEQIDFFKAVLDALDGKWIKAVVSQGMKPDGTPVNRIKSFIGLGKEVSNDVVPF